MDETGSSREDEDPSTDATEPRMSQLAAWQSHWSSAFSSANAGRRELRVANVRDGALRGVNLLLTTRGLAGQWRDSLADPQPEQSQDLRRLAEGVKTLQRLISALPNGLEFGLRSDLDLLANSFAQAAGATSALPPMPNPNDGLAPRRNEIARRVAERRTTIADTLVRERQGPLDRRCLERIAEAAAKVSDLEAEVPASSPNDLDHEYWQARLFALEHFGNDPAALATEMEHGCEILATSLAILQRELTEPTTMGGRGQRGSWHDALDRTIKVAEPLKALHPGLPAEIHELSQKTVGLWNNLAQAGFDQADNAGRAEILFRHAPMLGIDSAITALANQARFEAEHSTDALRPPLNGGGWRWRERPSLPDKPITWSELRPTVLARTEYVLERQERYGPQLAQNYVNRLLWVFENVGPIAEEIAGRPFDLSGIALNVNTPDVYLRDSFDRIDRSRSTKPELLSVDEVKGLVGLLERNVPGATHFREEEPIEWSPGGKPTTNLIYFVAHPRHDDEGKMIDPDLPVTDAFIARLTAHEWRHYLQTLLARGESGAYSNVITIMDGHHNMIEADGVDFSRAVLIKAAERGVLDPVEVSKELRSEAKDIARWRFPNPRKPWITPDPTDEPYAQGSSENRIITLGLDAESRRAVLEHIMADPERFGRRDGEPLTDWGIRVRAALAPDQKDNPPGAAANPPGVPTGSGNAARIWRPGTKITRPGTAKRTT